MLFWDGRNVGLRTPYNGVLLLDTILQTPVVHQDDTVRIEILLTEALLLLYSLQSLEESGTGGGVGGGAPSSLENTADLQNELLARIDEASKAIASAAAAADQQPEGIKAQKWRTVCLELPQAYFKTIATGMVQQLNRLDRHIPALTITSSISERLTDLLVGGRMLEAVNAGAAQRGLMYAEATRRQTFARWPHMDYKWALPNQMAQAGFYHQPSSTGDDRAMCFTCNVCLVCWEKTDEPWSEHERHSPTCPFVRGEYTQNVPLIVSYATDAAVVAAQGGSTTGGGGGGGFDVMSTGTDTNIVCSAGSETGRVVLWNVKGQLRRCGQFCVRDDSVRVAHVTGGEPLRLHAISAYRSWEPAARVRGTGKGLRLACAVTTTDKQFLFVYRTGKAGGQQQQHQQQLAAKDAYAAVHPTNIEEANAGSAMPVCSSTLKNIQYEEDDVQEWTMDDDNVAPALLNYDELTELAQQMDHTEAVVAGQPTATLAEQQPLGHVDNQSSATASSITESLGEPGDVQVHFLSSVHIQPLLDGRYDITDLILSYDNKFLLVIMRNATIVQSAPTPTSNATRPVTKTAIIDDHSMDVDDPPTTNDYDNDANNNVDEGGGDDDDDVHVEVVDVSSDSDGTPAATQLLVYQICADGTIYYQPISSRILFEGNTPVQIAAIPSQALIQLEANTSANASGPAVSGSANNSVAGSGAGATAWPVPVRVPHATNSEDDMRTGADLRCGGFAMVCQDGSLQLLALLSLRTVSERFSQTNGRYVSTTYCRNLDRLCAGTADGQLHFYACYDVDSESDEADDEIYGEMTDTSTLVPDNSSGEATGGDPEVGLVGDPAAVDTVAPAAAASIHVAQPSSAASSAAAAASAAATAAQASSSGGSGASPKSPTQTCGTDPNLLANKASGGLQLDDLRRLHALTLFDLPVHFAAEVPSNWTELSATPKQRRHTTRPGDADVCRTKSWRLHNDVYVCVVLFFDHMLIHILNFTRHTAPRGTNTSSRCR